LPKNANVATNDFSVQTRLAHIDSVLTYTKAPVERIKLAMKKAIVLLEYGDEAAAASLLEQILGVVGENKNARIPCLYWLGTAYLRLAERTNCVSGHTADACIMPLQASGIHQDKNGFAQGRSNP
jgi:hypothetical protein